MRAEMMPDAGLSPQQQEALRVYAENLLFRGRVTPDVDDTTEVLRINVRKLEKPDMTMDIAGVRVHFSGGHMWQKSVRMGFPTIPMDALPGGIYPVAWLRGTREAAILDVVRMA